jgi:hypothetical protein
MLAASHTMHAITLDFVLPVRLLLVTNIRYNVMFAKSYHCISFEFKVLSMST